VLRRDNTWTSGGPVRKITVLGRAFPHLIHRRLQPGAGVPVGAPHAETLAPPESVCVNEDLSVLCDSVVNNHATKDSTQSHRDHRGRTEISSYLATTPC
jgi:hypothetical protein